MFQVFVDSAANLPAVTAKKYDIHVVSFVNLVNGKELVCFDPELSPEEERAKGKEYYDAMHSAQGILAIYASEMRDKGMTVEEAADLLETYVGPDTIALFYLAKDRELL